MKILKDNSKNKWILPFKVQCFRCKSELEVDSNDDIKTYTPQPMDTDGRSFLYVNCPVCKNMIAVHPKSAL